VSNEGERPRRSGARRTSQRNGERPASPAVAGDAHAGERLQKYLAHAGVASRRHAEELIAAGLVVVNGQVVIDGGDHTGALPGRVLRFRQRAA